MRFSVASVAILLALVLTGTAEKNEKGEQSPPVLVIYAFDSPDNPKMAEKITDSIRMRAGRLESLVVVDGLSTDDMLEADDRPTIETPLEKVVALTKDVFDADLALWGRIAGSGDEFTLHVKGLDLRKDKSGLVIDEVHRTEAKRQLNWLSDEVLAELTGKRKPGIVEADPEAARATPTKGPNLVPNGDFERGTTSPEDWDRVNGLTTFYEKGPKGRCLKIDTDVYESEFNAWMKKFEAGAPASQAPKKTPTSGPKYDTVAGNYGQSYYSASIPVTPGKRYKVSLDFCGRGKVWVRGYGKVSGEQRRVFDGYLNLKSASDSEEWQTAVRILKIPAAGETAAPVEVVRIVIYAYWPPGTYWFDNVGLWEVDEEKAADEPLKRCPEPSL